MFDNLDICYFNSYCPSYITSSKVSTQESSIKKLKIKKLKSKNPKSVLPNDNMMEPAKKKDGKNKKRDFESIDGNTLESKKKI